MGSPSNSSQERNPRKPIGIRLLEKYRHKGSLSFKTHQSIVLIVTFLAYATYHATRKTTSVVKTTLDPQKNHFYTKSFLNGWSPFNEPNGASLLGEIDVSFLAAYSIGMLFAGHLGDRVDLRVFLSVGMVGTGLFTSLFGVAYWANIHSLYYFFGIQILAGLFQSTGWPLVVAVMGNWFGKKRRGLVMGIWTAHTSFGNILGSLIGSALLQYGWGWSFAVPGFIITVGGFLVFLILPVSPECVGVDRNNEDGLKNDVKESLLGSDVRFKDEAVGFFEAWRIPGVAPFALCLFFAKLVAYTFLYWLPFYIGHTVIDGRHLSDETSGNLSTLFDVGGVLGGILAGHVSDRMNARAITSAAFVYCAIPTIFLYRSYGHVSVSINALLMLGVGMFVNGPYALITTAVSTDLGTHASLRGNARAVATVTAIIDGTGSVGAALGPLLTGFVSQTSWDAGFMMLMGGAFFAGLLLTRLVVSEVGERIEGSRLRSVEL